MPTNHGKPKIEFAHGRSLNASGDTVTIAVQDTPVNFTAFDSTDQSILGMSSGVVTCPKGTFLVQAWAVGGHATEAIAMVVQKSTDSGSTWTEVQDSFELTAGVQNTHFVSCVVDLDDDDQLALGFINGAGTGNATVYQTSFDVVALSTYTNRRKGAE